MAATKRIAKNQGKPIEELTQFEIGYIMGIVAGEGSFTQGGKLMADGSYIRGGLQWSKLCIGMHSRDLVTLQHIQNLIGGRINGPYTRHGYSKNGHPMVYYQLDGRGLRKVLPLFRKYLPMSYKRIQFEVWQIENGLTQVNVGETSHHLESTELSSMDSGVSSITNNTSKELTKLWLRQINLLTI